MLAPSSPGVQSSLVYLVYHKILNFPPLHYRHEIKSLTFEPKKQSRTKKTADANGHDVS